MNLSDSGEHDLQAAANNGSTRSSRRAWLKFLLVLLLVVVAATAITKGLGFVLAPASRGLLPADFESHQGLLLAWSPEFNRDTRAAFTATIAAAADNIQIMVLVSDRQHRAAARQLIDESDLSASRIRFVEHSFDSPWLRDFGPLLTKSYEGGYEVVDYPSSGIPLSASLTRSLAADFGFPVTEVPLRLQPANLLSNGAGLCLTTTLLLDENRDRGYSERRIRRLMKEYFGAQQVVFLEPLQGEPTGQVNVFATFASHDTVVLGEYAESADRANREILERNARSLKGIQTAAGPLKVERIPMPARTGDTWLSYTKAIFANGILLVPNYPSVPAQIEEDAHATFRRLLPDWRLVPITESGLDRNFQTSTLNLLRLGREGNR